MKKSIINALSMFLLLASSCGNKGTDAPPSGTADTAKKVTAVNLPMKYTHPDKKNDHDILDAGDFDKADFDLVKARLHILSTCVGAACSDPDDYCDAAKPQCLDSINNCHTIDNVTFNRMTGNGGNGYAVLASEAIDVFKAADCKKYIRLTCSAMFYNIAVVDSIDTALKNTAYYSVALMQKIAQKPVQSIEVHKAILDAASGKYLVPFKVHFSDGNVLVYDVSSDLP